MKAEGAMRPVLGGLNASTRNLDKDEPTHCLEVLGSERTTIDWEARGLWSHSSVRSGIGKSALTGMDGKEIPPLGKT